MATEEETVGTCPNCGTPRGKGDTFCEVCGLDYETGQLPETPAAPSTREPASGPAGWSLTIEPDRAWFDQNEAEKGRTVEYPANPAPRTIELTGNRMTIGRRDDRNAWYPDIDLSKGDDDTGVSRRHGELRATDDGWELVDTDSTNGTVLNDEDLTPEEPAALHDGDIVHVGAFTRLVVHGPAEGEPGAVENEPAEEAESEEAESEETEPEESSS